MRQVRQYEFETYLESIGQIQVKRNKTQEMYLQDNEVVAVFIRPNQFLIPSDWKPTPKDDGQLLLF